VWHAGKLFALFESTLPFELSINPKDGKFESIGYHSYEGRLNHAFTAHPKVDEETGEMFTFGYNFKEARTRAERESSSCPGRSSMLPNAPPNAPPLGRPPTCTTASSTSTVSSSGL
jgi:hypothetical protein